jgi:cathepsin L
MGVNEFAALTPAEFKASMIGNGHAPERVSRSVVGMGHDDAALAELLATPKNAYPTSLDWREKGVVTDVKDQGQCGGCWSFSTAETVESAVAIASGKLLVFSEQELIACTENPNDCGGTGGCNGATQELGFQAYINNSVTLESDYPYQAQTTVCDTSKIIPVANISGYVVIPFNNYTATMNAVATVGPIAISAAAAPWQLYSSGVFSSPCGSDVDHAIQLVGYGHDDSVNLDYYLVRNSWSSSWGEEGYIKIARYGETPQGEPCFTDNTPGDGDGCDNGPSSIQVCGLCGILSDSSYATGAKLL